MHANALPAADTTPPINAFNYAAAAIAAAVAPRPTPAPPLAPPPPAATLALYAPPPQLTGAAAKFRTPPAKAPGAQPPDSRVPRERNHASSQVKSASRVRICMHYVWPPGPMIDAEPHIWRTTTGSS